MTQGTNTIEEDGLDVGTSNEVNMLLKALLFWDGNEDGM
jgi:hypothetical protein